MPVGLVPTSRSIQTIENVEKQVEEFLRKYCTVRLDERAKSVEEPTMTVEFFLVLLLQAEYDLYRASRLRYFA